jgi:hypothetical protein
MLGTFQRLRSLKPQPAEVEPHIGGALGARKARNADRLCSGGTFFVVKHPNGIGGVPLGWSRMNRLFLVLLTAALSGGAAFAQLSLPGAAAPDTPAATAPETEAPAAKPKHRARRSSGGGVGALVADPAALDGKTLRLNGRNGELRLAKGPDGKLQIVKFALAGEVISNPAQRCKIDIVSDKPLDANPQGAPDGLPRFAAAIPACPLTFDVVADGVLAPPQANACVFAAADCQASPSGLWGPESADLEKDPRAIARTRALADRSIQDSLHELVRRDKDAAAPLTRQESDFAAERDDLCHDYAGEARLGFCASRVQQSRAALLIKRLAEAGPAKAAAKTSRKRKK